MASKFLNLIESTIQKMTNGGILTGDRVELVDNYKSHKGFTELPEEVQNFIEKIFKDTDLNKKVINIKTEYPSTAPGNEDNRGTSFIATVAVELTNGLYDNENSVSVPMSILVADDGGHGADFGSAPVPDSVKYDNKVQIDPVEVEENEEQQQTMTQQGDSLKKSERSLAKKNTKIPSKPATPSPAVNENYTAQYMS
jgi:hypothetical protein